MTSDSTQTNGPILLQASCVYVGGVLIGLTLVSFPASSAVLKGIHHFSDIQYGAIYLPQLIMAIVGAVLGGVVETTVGLKRMFLASLVAFACAQGLLALSAGLPTSAALVAIMMATGCFGFGFGFGGGPLNAFAVLLFPRRTGAAVTALHMCAGAGLTVGPFFFATLAAHHDWIFGPLSLLLVSVVLLALTTSLPFPRSAMSKSKTETAPLHPGLTLFFWASAICAVLYSISEGIFSNWLILFLHDDRHFSDYNAAAALSIFWLSITTGRLLATMLAIKIPPLVFLTILPCLMTTAFLLLPHINSVRTGFGAFAFAGLSCSAFFPMLVGFSASRFPMAVSWIASMLTAAMMVGVGIGSYVIGALHGLLSISQLYTYAVVAPLSALIIVAVANRLGSRKSARVQSFRK
jgi:MFS family permease